MRVTKKDLYNYLYATKVEVNRDVYIEDHDGTISQKAWDYLHANRSKFEAIRTDWAMSEHHLGGDNMIDLAVEVAKVAKKGFEIVTWYGPDTEVLIIGIKGGWPLKEK